MRSANRSPARRAALLAAALALAGCAVPPAPAPSGPPLPPAPPLVVERQWLQQWFRDTPVRIAQQGSGPVEIEVPREFCFDPGRSRVKPALGAVLDKLAQSLRRVPDARLETLAAPGDGVSAAASPLARQRAQQLLAELRARGVPAARLGAPTASGVAAVRLRMVLAPAS